jgi:hypothetical protein
MARLIIMKSFTLYTLLIGCVLLFGINGCTNPIRTIFPKPPRAFQEKNFDSKQWRDGDPQDRGEMAVDLNQGKYEKSSPNNLTGKSPVEVLQLLGEPDKKTIGKCCFRSPPDVQVWLYKLQRPDGPKGELKEHAFQIYFTEDGKTVQDYTFTGEMEDHPVYIPNIG